MSDLTRDDAERDERTGMGEVEHVFSDGVTVTLCLRTEAILDVFLSHGGYAEVTDDLEAMGTPWESMLRWYGWLTSHAARPSGCYLDGAGLDFFIGRYEHMAGQWIEEARAAQVGAA